jgi:hypothetical protein
MTTLTDEQINDMASVMRDSAYLRCEEIVAKLNSYGLDAETHAERYRHWRDIKHSLPTKKSLAALLRQELGA